MPNVSGRARVTGGRVRATPLEEKRAASVAERIAAARTAIERCGGRHRPALAARAAIWHWDLASGRVEWDERLKALFGYTERVTDAAWRGSRIHPEDHERVEVSLQRATIENHGAVWSDRYRFRQADGSYAAVVEHAYVVNDEAGPRAVLGAITKTPPLPRFIRSRSFASEPGAQARTRA